MSQNQRPITAPERTTRRSLAFPLRSDFTRPFVQVRPWSPSKAEHDSRRTNVTSSPLGWLGEWEGAGGGGRKVICSAQRRANDYSRRSEPGTDTPANAEPSLHHRQQLYSKTATLYSAGAGGAAVICQPPSLFLLFLRKRVKA